MFFGHYLFNSFVPIYPNQIIFIIKNQILIIRGLSIPFIISASIPNPFIYISICFDKSTYPIAAPASVASFLNYYLNFIFYLHFYIIRIIFSKQAYEQKTALLVQNSTIYHNKKREPLHNICKSSLFSYLNLYSSIQNKIVTINFPCIFFIL